MLRQMYGFITGMFTFAFFEGLWCAPDYYIHGDITRTAELLWVAVPLVMMVYFGRKWYLEETRD